jgi:hypothetical protein
MVGVTYIIMDYVKERARGFVFATILCGRGRHCLMADVFFFGLLFSLPDDDMHYALCVMCFFKIQAKSYLVASSF